MDIAKYRKIYDELLKCEVTLNYSNIPTPSYIQQKIIECNHYQHIVERYFIEVTRDLSIMERLYTTEKLDIETLKRTALVNNEKIKKLPSAKEREAAVDELLEHKYREILEIENNVNELRNLLSVIKQKQATLKGVNSDIKSLLKLMDNLINGLKVPSAEDKDIKSLNEIYKQLDEQEKRLEENNEELENSDDLSIGETVQSTIIYASELNKAPENSTIEIEETTLKSSSVKDKKINDKKDDDSDDDILTNILIIDRDIKDDSIKNKENIDINLSDSNKSDNSDIVILSNDDKDKDENENENENENEEDDEKEISDSNLDILFNEINVELDSKNDSDLNANTDKKENNKEDQLDLDILLQF